MNEFTTEELERIASTMEEGPDGKKSPEDCYYVYMLATKENPISPFYIGKGKGTRIFSHESEAEKVIDAIKDIGGMKTLDKDVSDKIKKIIQGRKGIVKYIIKWGLSEQEAFMCESSLMNLYNCLKPDELTNIVNGHRSKKEEGSKSHITKAYEISEFLKDVCIEEICYEDSSLKEIPVIFVKIQNALSNYENDCKEKGNDIDYEQYVYQCAQGYWPGKDSRTEGAKYVIALQNRIIRGIYPIDLKAAKDLVNSEDAPEYPLRSRANDKKSVENEEKTFLNKWGFVKKRINGDEERELNELKDQLLNKILKEKNPIKKDWLKEQKSTYNYDYKNGKLKVHEQLRQLKRSS